MYLARLTRHCDLGGLKRAALFALLLSGVPSPTQAWGTEGHRIVADIAERYLEPTTVHQVRDLLALDNATTLAEVSNWADQIRDQRPDTAPWHFVNIPIGAPGYDPSRDCPGGACVIAKIDEFASELPDIQLSSRQRLEALKFVVHFVADVHQPLHASDDDDRGGNEVRVEFLGRRTNLHAVWDAGILEPAIRGDERGYALSLASAITPVMVEAWSKSSPIDWANESHLVAERVIYNKLPHMPGVLPTSYERAALPIVNEQLEKAGVRLAALLNSALGTVRLPRLAAGN